MKRMIFRRKDGNSEHLCFGGPSLLIVGSQVKNHAKKKKILSYSVIFFYFFYRLMTK